MRIMFERGFIPQRILEYQHNMAFCDIGIDYVWVAIFSLRGRYFDVVRTVGKELLY